MARDRFNHLIIGQPSGGKSELAKKIALAYNAGNVIVYDCGFAATWRQNFQPITSIEQLKRELPAIKQGWTGNPKGEQKAGLFRISIEGKRQYKEIMFELNKDKINGLLILDDFARVEPNSQLSDVSIDLVTAYRHHHCDVITMFHSCNVVIKDCYVYASGIYLLNTTNPPDKSYRKIPKMDLVEQAWYKIKYYRAIYCNYIKQLNPNLNDDEINKILREQYPQVAFMNEFILMQ